MHGSIRKIRMPPRILSVTVILAFSLQKIRCDSQSCDVNSGSSTDTSTTDNLVDKLLCEYDVVSTPSDNTTIVRVDFNLTRLTLDVKSGLAQMDVNMTMEWTDPRLKWESALFDVDELIMTRRQIWVPDIEPLNSVRSGSEFNEPLCVVHNSGSVKCHLPLAMSVACGDSALRWPNDDHTCKVEISSLSHSSTDFRIQLHQFTTPVESMGTKPLVSPFFPLTTAKNAVPDGWLLLNASMHVRSEIYDSFEWTRVILLTQIKRDVASHVVYLAAPFLVLSLLSLSPALLPATGSSLNARLILGGVAITGHILQLQNLAEVVPDSIDWKAPYIVCLHRDAMWAACVLLILSMPGAMLLDGEIPGIEGAVETPCPQNAKPPPAMLVSAAAWLLNRVPRGALLLDNETDVSALVEDENDEGAGVPTPTTSSRSWRGLVLLFDRVLLVVFIIVYASLLLAYLT